MPRCVPVVAARELNKWVTTRADYNTPLSVQGVVYRDLTPNMDLNPVTGSLATLTNGQAVASALRFLVLTMLGERRFQPNVGSQAMMLLFEYGNDPVTQGILATSIQQCIAANEPRALLASVTVQASGDSALTATITFGLVNAPGQRFSTTVPLTRIR